MEFYKLQLYCNIKQRKQEHQGRAPYKETPTSLNKIEGTYPIRKRRMRKRTNLRKGNKTNENLQGQDDTKSENEN